VKVKAGSLYRLSVSGFETREAAGKVCSRIKAAGGQCFVRSIAGDAPLQWAQRGGTKIAARK
jgi:cell division protein FtsN